MAKSPELPEMNVCEVICPRDVQLQCQLARQLRRQLTPIPGDQIGPPNPAGFISRLPRDPNFQSCARPELLLGVIEQIYEGKQLPDRVVSVVTNLQNRIP